MRIGELSRRHGVSPDLLRVWERRYGLLEPERTGGGFRLYTPRDDERVRVMRHNLELGYTAAVAARMALRSPAPAGAADPRQRPRRRARGAPGAAGGASRTSRRRRILDRRWPASARRPCCGTWCCPACASSATAGRRARCRSPRSTSPARSCAGACSGWPAASTWAWARAPSWRAPRDDRHDLGLLCFGIGLRERGWRVTFLGADTPIDALHGAAVQLQPALDRGVRRAGAAAARGAPRDRDAGGASIRWPWRGGRRRPRWPTPRGRASSRTRRWPRPRGSRREADRGPYSLWETTLRGGRGAAVCHESRRLRPSSAAVL